MNIKNMIRQYGMGAVTALLLLGIRTPAIYCTGLLLWLVVLVLRIRENLNKISKVLMAILAVAVAAYLGLAVYRSLLSPDFM